MHKVIISDGKILYAEDGALLSKVLIESSIGFEHPCGGNGVCGKCTLSVNGENVLSCKYEVKSDIIVELKKTQSIETATVKEKEALKTESECLCLDIGTTTIVLAKVENGEIKTITRNNPQRAFGSDVMSRIDYASKNGVEKLRDALIDEINFMIDELCVKKADKLYVAGNTTMLHIFFGIDPSPMGCAPYVPGFLSKKNMPGEKAGIKNVNEVISLPNISAFVGADVVSGLGYVGFSDKGYNLLVDLGTNAEVVLYSKEKLYSTAAAAGPCFEGVNISCGMSAVEGAIYSFSKAGIKTIGGGKPVGICATGLIDVLAQMLEAEIFDETGYMECEKYELCENVFITQKDIRQFQLAKSAIYSSVKALMKRGNIKADDIEKVYIAGGFSSKMNIENAIKVGLFDKEFLGKTEAVNNSSLSGVIKYATENVDYDDFLKNAEYVDLAADEYFGELFIENMGF